MPAVPFIMVGIAAYSAYATIKAGQSQKKAALAQGNAAVQIGAANQEASESEARLSDYNARVAEMQAIDAELRGEWEAERLRNEVNQVIGRQRAGFAAGNIDVGFGSAVDVQADAAMLGELDILTIRSNAAREAWGYRVQGADLAQRAAIQRLEGKNAYKAGQLGLESAKAAGSAAMTAAYLSAGGTLLNVGSSYLQARYPVVPKYKLAGG
jgi:hypothetical protein